MEDNRIVDLYWARSEDAITETSEKYGKYCYAMQQIHGVHPGVFGKINPMRRLFQSTRLHELIKNRF